MRALVVLTFVLAGCLGPTATAPQDEAGVSAAPRPPPAESIVLWQEDEALVSSLAPVEAMFRVPAGIDRLELWRGPMTGGLAAIEVELPCGVSRGNSVSAGLQGGTQRLASCVGATEGEHRLVVRGHGAASLSLSLIGHPA